MKKQPATRILTQIASATRGASLQSLKWIQFAFRYQDSLLSMERNLGEYVQDNHLMEPSKWNLSDGI
jgi:hypothetical protein